MAKLLLLETRFRTWLHRLMLQTAVSSAYQTFAQEHPRWAASFFDEYFLRGQAAPLLARYLQTESLPTPNEYDPLRDQAALRRAVMNIPAFKALRDRSDFFGGPHLFCLSGVTEAGHTFARHLDAPPDLLEDPFTGSATGGIAAYLWRYGLLDEPKFIAAQGHWLDRPGQATVEVIGPRDDIETVKVGGRAVTIMRGDLVL